MIVIISAAHYACMRAPAYVTASNGESPCGEENCLQWIPPSRVSAFNHARGPASEPTVRQASFHAFLLSMPVVLNNCDR